MTSRESVGQVGAMHIGELASRTGLSLRTVRHWEAIGLISASGRTDGGFRIFTERDVSRLLIIRSLKPCDFALEELQELMGLYDALVAGTLLPTELAAARARFLETVAEADRRLKMQRERLITAELAVTLLRAAGEPEAPPEPAAGPRPGAGR